MHVNLSELIICLTKEKQIVNPLCRPFINCWLGGGGGGN